MNQHRFRTVREGIGLSQSDVARALGINNSAVNRWESGQAVPTLKHLVALTELYSCSMDDLVVIR